MNRSNTKQTEFDLRTLINYFEREGDIDREIIMTAIEQAIMKAASKNVNVTNDFRIEIDRNKLELHAYDTFVVSNEDSGVGFITVEKARRYKKDRNIEEGDVVEIEIPAEYLGRIVANSSKQMILQKIREAKRTNVFNDYVDRIGCIVSGIVSGVERGDVYVMVGKHEMVMPKKEQIHREKYSIGDAVKAVILSVDRKTKRSPVTISRASNKFLESVLKNEISEIGDGTVEIVSISRDPGSRAKISLISHNDKVDSVGACIGKGGMRIKNLMRELGGEKLDIIRYSDDIVQCIKDALSPAKIDDIEVVGQDGEEFNVIVSGDNYAKALGRNGQNVTLASKLLGVKLNVKKSVATMSFDERKCEAIREMADSLGISLATASQIVSVGYLNTEGIASDDVVSFASATGLDEVEASGIHAAASAIQSMI